MTKEALKLALEALKDNQHLVADNERHVYVMEYNGIIEKCEEALAQPEQKKERCVGCEACIDTACGRAECPKGWPKTVQPEQEPVAWRYKPVREDNPRWEYTTNHPLDMGDGYLRPSLVEYCKCIEPLYAKEKPKLMLEKFREMADLLEEPAQQEPATKEQIREAIVFNLPLYTTPPQRVWVGLTDDERMEIYNEPLTITSCMKAVEAKLKEKNT